MRAQVQSLVRELRSHKPCGVAKKKKKKARVTLLLMLTSGFEPRQSDPRTMLLATLLYFVPDLTLRAALSTLLRGQLYPERTKCCGGKSSGSVVR